MRIAIVDDLETERAQLKTRLARQLRLCGAEADLLEFESGESFLAAEKEQRFTAAFLDIYMHGMSGMDAAKELRKTDADCLLVFTTTSTDHALEGFQVRALHYLVKPFSEEELSALLAEMLARLPRPEPVLTVKHHWSDLFDVDIMDAEGPDVEWPVENGKVLKVNYLGKNIENYDSMLVLIHFKGHPMGGYGGALKQLSIGCASSAGKAYIHSGGKVTDQHILWENCAEQDTFLEAMADAASTVAKHFAGKIAYVAVMKNLSVDCDCCAVAEDPCMNDVGILSSLDPVALDRACIDLVINSNDPGRDHFMERVNSRHGTHTIDTAETLGIGTQAYELVKV